MKSVQHATKTVTEHPAKQVEPNAARRAQDAS
jgi:hypothetical protein